MDLSDKQWQQLAGLLPVAKPRGRPRRDDRGVLDGILWILRTGAPWKDLPERYPPYQTCHRRFQSWTKEDVMAAILEQLAQDLHEQGDIDLSECFIDGTFAAAKKGGLKSARPSAAKVPKLWPSQTVLVFRSPLTYELLRDTRPSLSQFRATRPPLVRVLQALLKHGLSPIYPNDSWVIKPMTVIP